MKKELAYDVIHQSADFTFDMWNKLMKNTSKQDIVSMPDAENNSGIAFLSHLPHGKGVETSVIAVVVLNKSKISKTTDYLKTNLGDNVVISAFYNNRMFYSNDNKVLPIDKKVLERGNFESDLRRLFSVEWMKIVENDPEKFNVGADEKIEIMRIQESKLKETAAEYFKFSIPFYIANKHRQEEFFQKIISLTDEIVKSGSKNEPVHIDEL